MTQDYNRYSYALNNPLVYIDQDGELPILAIIGIVIGFAYLKAAHHNTPKQDQGNLSKWNWNPLKWDWENADYVVTVGNNTGPSGGIGGAASVGWGDDSMINLGYNQKSGPGIGIGKAGTSNIYYPKYDYSKPEKAANKAIQNYNFEDTFLGNSSGLEIDYIIGVSYSAGEHDQFGDYLNSFDMGIGYGYGGSANIGARTYGKKIFHFW